MVYQHITVPPPNIIAAQAVDAANIYRARKKIYSFFDRCKIFLLAAQQIKLIFIENAL